MTPARRLPRVTRDADEVVQRLRAQLSGALDWSTAAAQAAPWVEAVRASPPPAWTAEAVLRAYPLASPMGRALMHLAESLLRIPDDASALALLADQLAALDAARGPAAQGIHAWLGQVLAWSGHKAGEWSQAGHTPWSAQALIALMRQGIRQVSQQFVLGHTLGEALAQAQAARQRPAARGHTLRFSYDMLGEGARCEHDAQHYFSAYLSALDTLAACQPPPARPEDGDGLSVKLSALFARFEEFQHGRVMDELLPRVLVLCERAAAAKLNLTFDAEESQRLELMLDVFEAAAAKVAQTHPRWRGLGLAVQAYQTRALETVDAVLTIAHRHRLRLMVRLVKGAYWDSEIKRAQELGLGAYPVFTHKAHTDLSYLACAQRLLDDPEALYPQFATHNAATLAAVMQLVAQRARGAQDYEWQRLHGMGQALHEAAWGAHGAPLRVYAPVGPPRHLLAYLIRRLLENAANTSFVHQLTDPAVPVPQLLRSPFIDEDDARVGAADAWLGPARRVAAGVDLHEREVQEDLRARVNAARPVRPSDVDASAASPIMERLHAAWPMWAARPVEDRCAVLERAADLIERDLLSWSADVIVEARKTWGDAVAEVREAIDYLRYYAREARALAPTALPAPVGEANRLLLRARGVFVCISPWNFPLAIFTGQVAAALVCGNAVAAKPAEQTPAVAARLVALLHEAGVPADVLQCVVGAGEHVGAALVGHPLCAGVAFTGSDATARAIQRTLAEDNRPIVPLIAETGGINAMIVDSTGLPEQIVDGIVASAFLSAGQRCSALRLLCLHADVADEVLAMLAGAMQELRVGDAREAATDVGPLIDEEAFERVQRQVRALRQHGRLVAETRLPAGAPAHCLAPLAFEIDDIARAREEIFAPVLQIVRWGAGTRLTDLDALVDAVNALGYGLTLGIQTRIEQRAQAIAARARVGNVYVNRAMTGAVVGVHPFGGMQRSGTGPKAGGPHYLKAFCTEQTISINTASIGGNLELLQ